MVRYIAKRILWMIPIFFGIITLIFTIMYLSPSDVTVTILGPGASYSARQVLREKMGLDQPYIVQLFKYIYQVCVHFDFGNSYVTGIPVMQSIAERLPRTMTIGIISMCIQVVIGIPLGVFAATHQDRLGDRSATFLALIGVSIPQFWLAMLLVILFTVKLGWLPAFGISSWKSFIMPCIAISLSSIAGLTRQTRSSMLEVVRSDYVTTARAKGVSEHAVIYMHALPNSLIPLITYIGNELGMIFGGTLVVETVFSIPGIGMYMTTGINSNDLPVVEGCVIVLGMIFAFIMLLVDIAYAFADPRIRAQYGKKKRKGEAE